MVELQKPQKLSQIIVHKQLKVSIIKKKYWRKIYVSRRKTEICQWSEINI